MTRAAEGGTVTVDMPSLDSALGTTGDQEVWLLFRTKSNDADGFFRILAEMNAVGAPDEGVQSALGTATAAGFVTMIDNILTSSDLERWATDLATRLSGAGFSGALKAAPEAREPDWFWGAAYSDIHPPATGRAASAVPTLYLTWELDIATLIASPHRDAEWAVAADTTADIANTLATWARGGGPSFLLRRGLFEAAVGDGPTLASTLAAAITEAGMAGLAGYDTSRRQAHYTSLNAGAESLAQVLAAKQGWAPRIDGIRSLLMGVPQHLRLGFVRPAVPADVGWDSVDTVQPLPDLLERHIRYNKHLLGDYAVDAHGIQVLTDSHLAKANDLAGWNVTGLGHGRHLVEAPDLEPWYGRPLPDPGTLTKARTDFGPMILTKDVIADQPAPWRT